MSTEIKIQETPAPEAGAQEPLSTDATTGRTRGGDFNQNQLSFSRGAEVSASSESVSTYGVAGVAVSVKPVDRRTIEGSTPGDSRAHGAPAVLPPNPAPRDGMTQTPNGRNCR